MEEEMDIMEEEMDIIETIEIKDEKIG